MIESLRTTYYRLVNDLETETFRALYHSFEVNERLTGLVGPRGVGKTTLLLQFIKNRLVDLDEAFYVSADHIFFNTMTLYEFVQQLYEEDGVQLFFIDEIHKYGNWSQELKNIYDSFPKVRVVFSGSSSLDLVKGSHDLSRRAVFNHMPGLSFREYLQFTTGHLYEAVGFEQLINEHIGLSLEISKLKKLRGHFKTYLQQGYYPFVFEGEKSFFAKLEAVIEKTIYEDIANYFNLKTTNLHYFKKILVFLATIPPGEISIHNLSKNLGVDDKTALSYIHILVQTGLVRTFMAKQRGTRLLRTPEKLFLENTTLLNAICNSLDQHVDLGTQRELFFVNALGQAGEKVFSRKKHGDFTVRDTVFEVGGKNKTRKQVQPLQETAYLVKDDILTGGKGSIPLYLFGFLS